MNAMKVGFNGISGENVVVQRKELGFLDHTAHTDLASNESHGTKVEHVLSSKSA